MRAADALFSGASARSSQTSDQASSTQALSTDDVPAAPPVEAPSPTGGRILRAIDEPPDTTLAEIEAERAPKRRGRKPGSKNKPKVQAATPSSRPAPEPVFDEDDETIPFGESPLAPRPGHSAPRLSPPLAFPTLVSRGARRFAWVRTKLGPGEQWKRRLPKVIW